MSNVKTYRAESMQEALDLVREELGSDAVILHTRQIERRSMLPWGKRRTEVEITAGTDVAVGAPTERTPAMSPALEPVAAAVTAPPPTAPRRPLIDETPKPPGQTSAAEILAAMEEQGTIGAIAAEFDRTTSPPTEPDPLLAPYRPGPSIARPASEADDVRRFDERLDRIQRMLESLDRSPRVRVEDGLPADLVPLYASLVEADMEPEDARELLDTIHREADDAADADARIRLHELVRNEVRIAGSIRRTPGERRVVALVGPTGVGKTTTLAKIAANLRLNEGLRMGLVTVDTYRIAAVDQLRTYAEIIDLPMKVVATPSEMRTAMQELADVDLVLIDTAGRSPRDDARIRELRELLVAADCDEVQLVLSMTSGARALERIAERFRPVGVTSAILTKLDEVEGLASLHSALRRIGLPIGYLTHGQDVPDDIAEANADLIARMVTTNRPLTAAA